MALACSSQPSSTKMSESKLCHKLFVYMPGCWHVKGGWTIFLAKSISCVSSQGSKQVRTSAVSINQDPWIADLANAQGAGRLPGLGVLPNGAQAFGTLLRSEKNIGWVEHKSYIKCLLERPAISKNTLSKNKMGTSTSTCCFCWCNPLISSIDVEEQKMPQISIYTKCNLLSKLCFAGLLLF